MEKILDRAVPHHLVRKAKTTKYFHPQTLALLWDPKSSEARYTNQHCKPLFQHQKLSTNTTAGRDEMAMYDLVYRTLDYDPQLRITLREALRHYYFDRLNSNSNNKLRSAVSEQHLASFGNGKGTPEQLSRHVLRLQI